MKNRITKQIKTTNSVEVTRSDIIQLVEKKCDVEIPPGAKVCVHIPGGGDWSNVDLDIGVNDTLVHVSWEVRTRE